MSTGTIATFSAIATRLNDRVRTEIDGRLFLIANFKAPLDTPPSFSGKYYQYVQTLYRFAIDCGCIISDAYRGYLPRSIIQNNPRLEDLNKSSSTSALGLINLLRAYIDHNVAQENGWFCELQEDNYCHWVSNITGKDEPKNEDDYARLCSELERQANHLVDALDAFIGHIAGLPASERQKAVNKWETDILDWYTSGTMRRDWYLGQMANIYTAEAAGCFGVDRLGPRNARYILENWLREYYDRPDCPGELENALEQEMLGHRRRSNCATDYFFKYGYKQRLKATLDAHPSLNMLPQDLMQQDITDRLSDALDQLLYP